MHFDFVVRVDVERQEGKFASKDELRDAIQEALDGANPDQLEGENGGVYDITEWDVSEEA